MQPIRKVMTAEHFKKVPDPNNPYAIKWTPCSPGDPDAVEKSWSSVESDELLDPLLKIADFLKSLSTVRPTVTDADVRRHEQWTMESGAPIIILISQHLLMILQGMMEHDPAAAYGWIISYNTLVVELIHWKSCLIIISHCLIRPLSFTKGETCMARAGQVLV
jgi:hypothetical protein